MSSTFDPPQGGSPSNDADLFRRVRRGDVDAMNLVLSRHWVGVVEYALRFCSNRDAAEDIAQDVFIRVWRGAVRWKGTGSLKAFLYGIARNLARNEGRKWRQTKMLSLESIDHLPGATSSPADTTENAFAEAAYRRAVTGLPARRQEIFNLIREHGLTYQEIADALGISVQTVANQMSAALAQLRRELRRWLEP